MRIIFFRSIALILFLNGFSFLYAKEKCDEQLFNFEAYGRDIIFDRNTEDLLVAILNQYYAVKTQEDSPQKKSELKALHDIFVRGYIALGKHTLARMSKKYFRVDAPRLRWQDVQGFYAESLLESLRNFKWEEFLTKETQAEKAKFFGVYISTNLYWGFVDAFAFEEGISHNELLLRRRVLRSLRIVQERENFKSLSFEMTIELVAETSGLSADVAGRVIREIKTTSLSQDLFRAGNNEGTAFANIVAGKTNLMDEVLARELIEHLKSAAQLAGLTDKQRQVLQMKLMNSDIKFVEIAAAMGFSIVRARELYMRAIKKISADPILSQYLEP